MTTVFNFDFSNPTHAQIFSQVVALTSSAGVPMQVIGTGNQEVSQPTTPIAVEKKDKPIKALNDVRYHIKKQTGVDGKTLFCISRGIPANADGTGYLKNGGWTTAEKSCINNAIKNLKGISTIRVKVDFSFDAWGYKTKKEAEEMMATLPTSFSAEEVAKFQKTKRA